VRFLLAILACAALGACTGMPVHEMSATARRHAQPTVGPSFPVYVVKRAWHVDVGIAVADLGTPLRSISKTFPGATILLFGFGDRRYLLHKGPGNMLAALWPGMGVLLVTGLASQPEEAFGEANVMRLSVEAQQMEDLQTFIWSSLASHGSSLAPIQRGPYAGSAYYEAVQGYSAVRTCNTWAASALQAAGFPVRVFGTLFAWEVWHQVRRIEMARGAVHGSTH
jgi:Protein of unknown function (DUF2459)